MSIRIRIEAARAPFAVSFKRGNEVLLTVRHPAAPAQELRTEPASVTAAFPHFTLRRARRGGRWELSTSPADAPVELKIDLPGWWYGHGELIHQHFPLNKIMLPAAPLITFDNGPTGLSGKLTPAWFSSNGALILADSPIEAGLNQPPADFPRYAWSFSSEGRGPFAHRPFKDPGAAGDGSITLAGRSLDLKFHFSENALEAYRSLVRHFGRPAHTPPDALFSKPTWTTWARYKTEIDQHRVLRFADEILEHDFPHHVMEIDDRWQTLYGDLEFDPRRFPQPAQMIEQLHSRGFKVTAWAIPFLQPESKAFAEGARGGWLVRRADGSPYAVEWWQGRGGLLDVTDPAALEWFFERLLRLQAETGLDGFKFDAGEACFLPPDAATHRPIDPNEYTRLYVEAVSKHYRLTEVRAGWRNQRAPIFFRQWDKSSSWGLDNGLHSVLTGILALGLAGYPFILPDMVGGNAYEGPADAELMIRWAQLNALLPAVQFSLAPWDFGQECARLCRRYANLHSEYAPRILALAGESACTGAPIIRPLFWLDPADPAALACDDEFLLGDDLLVAPVLHPGMRTREIYLPRGDWRDRWTGGVLRGPGWVRDYPAPLETLPLFERA
jgi:alpha-glucosidase (family GH31 glycosyl hydrolase)